MFTGGFVATNVKERRNLQGKGESGGAGFPWCRAGPVRFASGPALCRQTCQDARHGPRRVRWQGAPNWKEAPHGSTSRVSRFVWSVSPLGTARSVGRSVGRRSRGRSRGHRSVSRSPLGTARSRGRRSAPLGHVVAARSPLGQSVTARHRSASSVGRSRGHRRVRMPATARAVAGRPQVVGLA